MLNWFIKGGYSVILYDNIHSICQLVEFAAVENKDFSLIWYVDKDEIKDITFDEFAKVAEQ